jgi:hypothetical protein
MLQHTSNAWNSFDASNRRQRSSYPRRPVNTKVRHGKLMYQMQYSNSDIAQAVRNLKKHMAHGNSKTLDRLQLFTRYIPCLKNSGITLTSTRKWDGSCEFAFCIRGRSDSNYTIDTQTRCSISRNVVHLKDASTIHKSPEQKTIVALSSCKAEINTAVLCAHDMLFQKNMIVLIQMQMKLPIVLKKDKKGAAALINSFSARGRMQRTDVK